MAGSGAALAAGLQGRTVAAPRPFQGPICLFSKHLPGLHWKDLGPVVKNAGFEGVDLTVRPGGHVLPERAQDELEPAVQALRAAGVQVPMLTTALLSADDPAAEPILSRAGRLKVPYIKPGYYKYQLQDVRAELENVRRQLTRLVEMAARHGVQVGYHNHAGYVGGPVWDVAGIIEKLDPKWAGYYYDIRHAVVEGGGIGWKVSAQLVSSRLKMIAVKDFYWDKIPGKGWQQINCPLGQGMVNWPAFCSMLAAAGFQGPVSVHLEYGIPGQDKAQKQDNTLIAAKRDLEFLRKCLAQAYTPSSGKTWED
ncbi:MAG: sugar phosphate isomerase/epimerase family protein [Acidobacteriota bacterium]